MLEKIRLIENTMVSELLLIYKKKVQIFDVFIMWYTMLKVINKINLRGNNEDFILVFVYNDFCD